MRGPFSYRVNPFGSFGVWRSRLEPDRWKPEPVTSTVDGHNGQMGSAISRSPKPLLFHGPAPPSLVSQGTMRCVPAIQDLSLIILIPVTEQRSLYGFLLFFLSSKLFPIYVENSYCVCKAAGVGKSTEQSEGIWSKIAGWITAWRNFCRTGSGCWEALVPFSPNDSRGGSKWGKGGIFPLILVVTNTTKNK